jgi:F-type H+-transporting ATPase subunit gamma
MSDTLDSLRRKLDGATQLGAVVRAMKALAASSIGQYDAALRALGDYQQAVEIGLRSCTPDASTSRPRMQASIGAIVFGSDQGLVGRFNEVIADFALGQLGTMPASKQIWGVGDRVCEQVAVNGSTPAQRYTLPGSVAGISALVERLLFDSEAKYSSGEFASVFIFNNRPRSIALYAPVSLRLLPLDTAAAGPPQTLSRPTARFREVLGSREATYSLLVREYLFICLYKACAESLASENGSRLVAMQSAQQNIEALSAATSQSYYRLRQSSIDADLFDVMTGFNSLVTPRGSRRTTSART